MRRCRLHRLTADVGNLVNRAASGVERRGLKGGQYDLGAVFENARTLDRCGLCRQPGIKDAGNPRRRGGAVYPWPTLARRA